MEDKNYRGIGTRTGVGLGCRKFFIENTEEEIIKQMENKRFCDCWDCTEALLDCYRREVSSLLSTCRNCTESLVKGLVLYDDSLKTYTHKFLSKDEIEDKIFNFCNQNDFHRPADYQWYDSCGMRKSNVQLCNDCKLALFIWSQKRKTQLCCCCFVE